MPQINAPLYSLNAGVASKLGLGRIDLARLRIAAEVQQNLIPRVLGPATFRPGSAYLTRTHNDLAPKFVPFVFNAATKALLEVTSSGVRFLINGVPLTRVAVNSSITNGDFDSDISGWTDDDEAGAASTWATGQMVLTGTGTSFARRYQSVTTSDTGVEHALRIQVTRGPILISVGSTAGAENYLLETLLRTGWHSLAFIPLVSPYYVTVSSDADAQRLISSINIEAAGIVKLPHPWGADYTKIRYDQSADVMFVACDGIQQQRIERRSQRSWSVVDYNTLDGPFRPMNTSAATISPSGRSGNITLTANRGLFKPTQVGALFRLTQSGASVLATFTGDDQFTDSIRVIGVSTPTASDTRPFTILLVDLTGTGTTVTLQRSFGEEGSWLDVESYTTDQAKSFDDGFDNQIVFYRLGVKSGDYSSGSIDAALNYPSGSQQGVVRIETFSSTTTVGAEVISQLGAAAQATSQWEEGEWSDYRGFPSSVAFHDGRLWWGWKDRVFGTVSDDFTSYDDNVEGDSGPVIRSVATGPIEGIRWLLSMQRLLAGTASQEVSMRSSSFDEPITPTQFTARDFANRGCANIQAVNVDGRALYVQRNGNRVYGAGLDPNAQDYISTDLTRIVPDLIDTGIVDIAVQRQPDTRVWFVLGDGTIAVLIFEPADEVVAWITITTDGLFKAVGVLPGQNEDEVYVAVQRTNDDGTIMAVEKFAMLSEVVGNAVTKCLDSHVVYTGASTATITGLDHLEGLDVKAWAGGVPLTGTFTVSGGSITLPAAVVSAVVGLAYEGLFKSSKLAAGASTGSAVSKQKRVDHLALLMKNVAWKGVQIGKDFDTMTGLPATLGNGRPLGSTQVLDDYDYAGAPFNGGWGPDERFCFSISSPYCGTFLGVVIEMATNDPATFGTRPAGS